MKAEYRDQYADLYRRHWWWRAREALLVRLLRSLESSSRSLRILDIGCGEGLFFQALSALGSVDGYEPNLSQYSSSPYGQIFTSGLDDPHILADSSYDRVLLLDVLEHVDDDTSLLASAARVAKPDGYILITVPAYAALWTAHDEDNEHYRRYSPDSLRLLVKRSGLAVHRMGALFGWAALVKLIASYAERLLGVRCAGSSIPPGPINTFLTYVTRVEGDLMLRCSRTWGSSLYAVCRRPSTY